MVLEWPEVQINIGLQYEDSVKVLGGVDKQGLYRPWKVLEKGIGPVKP